MNKIKLSFAILTFNRSSYLSSTLDSVAQRIVEEAGDECDILVSDNFSTDNTSEIVKQYTGKYPFIKYFRSPQNVGFDLNVLNAANHAQGEYIWLFSDDDVLAKGAVKAVIDIINRMSPAYVYVNSSLYDKSLEHRIKHAEIKGESRLINSADEMLKTIGFGMLFMNSNIIKSSVFKGLKNPEKFNGSVFMHAFPSLYAISVGPSYYCSNPYIMQRGGNSVAGGRSFMNGVKWVIDYAHEIGFSNNATRNMANSFIYGMFIEGCRIGAAGGDKTQDFAFVYKLFGKYVFFWVFMVPLCIVPNKVLLMFRIILKRIFKK